MKKTILLLLIFVLLGGAAYLFSQKKEKTQRSTVLGWDRNFKIEKEEDIHKVFIAKRTGETTTLTRNGDHWLYNNISPVRPGAINSILEVLTSLRMQYQPPSSAIDNAVKELAAYGIKVEAYNKKGEKLKAFYIGGPTIDGRGTYAILEGSEQPYVVEIPTMEGNIRIRFEMEGDQWRDRAVFREQISDIQSISVEYPKQRNRSFKINKSGNNYSITPFYDITPAINKPVLKGEVEAYLAGFEEIIGEAFVNETPNQDSITNTIPFVIFRMKTTDGTEKQVTLFNRDNTSNTGEIVSDVAERYWAAVSRDNQRDFMLVQQRVFKRILWAYEFFY